MTDTTKPGASPSLPGHEAPTDADLERIDALVSMYGTACVAHAAWGPSIEKVEAARAALMAEIRRLRASRPSSEPGERARALEEAAQVAEAQAHLYGTDDPRWPGAAKAAIDIATSIRAITRNNPTEHTP